MTTYYELQCVPSYRVEVDEAGFEMDTPVATGCCEDGPETVGDCEEIGDCSLTPGDPSPVGRCVACGSLVYVENDNHLKG